MKTYIDNLCYDTEKAKLIDSVELSANSETPNYWRESLYLTPNGRWFWHLCGNAESKYPRERIEPADEEDVFDAWMEREQTELAAEYLPHLFQDA